MAYPSNKRDGAVVQAPARTDAAVWAEAIAGLDLVQVSRLRRLAGKLFLTGMGADEAVREARKGLEADSWRQPPRAEMLAVMGPVLINGDLRMSDGSPPPHVKDAVQAVVNTISVIRCLPAQEDVLPGARDQALDEAWRQKRWHVTRDACSACGMSFEEGQAPASKLGPIYHPDCREEAGRRIALTFARLVVAKVRERDAGD